MSTTQKSSVEAVDSTTALYNRMRDKARPLCDTFDARYTAWKATWENTEADGREEFACLAGMGIKILPLVVYKLCEFSDARTVDLYIALENDQDFKSHSPISIIENNYQRNLQFSELSDSWTRYKNDTSGDVQTALFCDEYDELVELGPSVVANAMLAYYDDFGGWWDELLCQLLSGHLSGAQVRFRDDVYRRWIDWFENVDGDGTAPYKLVGETAAFERHLRQTGDGHPYAELE